MPIFRSISPLEDLPILVEQSCGERDSLHDKLQVLDTLALLLESHGTAVVDVDDNIVKREPKTMSAAIRMDISQNIASPDDINSNLSGNVPCLNELIDLLGSALSGLLDARITRRVEALKALLLNGLL